MSIDLPGFADPMLGAQASFRAILDAMSRPGSIQAAGGGLVPPAPLMPATAAVLLTLVDADTSIAVASRFAPARDWIAFHCGATMVDDPAVAGFVVAADCPALDRLANGSDDGPETGATLVLQVERLGEGQGYRLSGPGLRVPVVLNVSGLPHDFAELWDANHGLFPRGVDIILCAGGSLAALPRSVHITKEA